MSKIHLSVLSYFWHSQRTQCRSLSKSHKKKTKTELEKLLQNIKEDNKKLEEMSTHLGTTIQNFNRDSEKMTQEINEQTDQLNLLVQKKESRID